VPTIYIAKAIPVPLLPLYISTTRRNASVENVRVLATVTEERDFGFQLPINSPFF